MFCMAKLSSMCGCTKGVSVDILYIEINDVLEYNPPYVQSGSIDLLDTMSLLIYLEGTSFMAYSFTYL